MPPHVSGALNAFDTSGGSPPPTEVEALSTLLAAAIVADIRKFPNLADAKAALDGTRTVVTPSGSEPRSTGRPSRCRAVRVVPAAA